MLFIRNDISIRCERTCKVILNGHYIEEPVKTGKKLENKEENKIVIPIK